MFIHSPELVEYLYDQYLELFIVVILIYSLLSFFIFPLFVVVVFIASFLFCFDFSFNIYSCIFSFTQLLMLFYVLDSLVIFLILREMALHKLIL